MAYSGRDIALFVIAFFFPPLAVLIKRGCGADFFINVLLSLLGAIPGVIHAFYIVHKYNESFEDIESGGLRYEPVPQNEPTRVVYGTTNQPTEYTGNPDITKHLESLKTRLGFARFKLRNGWKNNTLLDVETFWKEKQRQMVDSLPTPRFTQRDILDNRTLHPHYHYHQTQLYNNNNNHTISHSNPNTANNKQKQQRRHSHHHYSNKRAKLTRSLSTPITHSTSSSFQQQALNRQHSSLPFSIRHHNHQQGEEEDSLYFPTASSPTNLSSRKRKRLTQTPPSPPIDELSLHKTIHHHDVDDSPFQQQQQNKILTPTSTPSSSQKLNSSLDYLSYAVEITEPSYLYHDHDESDFVPSSSDENDDSDEHPDHHHSSLPLKTTRHSPFPIHGTTAASTTSSTSSITAAAEAMMMFGNHTQD